MRHADIDSRVSQASCALLAVFIAACWRGETAADKAHPPHVTVSAGQPRAFWGASRNSPHPLSGYGRESLPELATRLRATGPTDLPSFLSGPVVLLDLNQGTITTLCGNTAQEAAHGWGLKFADPMRPRPECRRADSVQHGIRCDQTTVTDIIELELEDLEPPRLTNVIVGSQDADTRLGLFFRQFRTQIRQARCP